MKWSGLWGLLLPFWVLISTDPQCKLTKKEVICSKWYVGMVRETLASKGNWLIDWWSAIKSLSTLSDHINFFPNVLSLTWSFISSNGAPISIETESIYHAAGCLLSSFLPSFFPTITVLSWELDLYTAYPKQDNLNLDICASSENSRLMYLMVKKKTCFNRFGQGKYHPSLTKPCS